MAFVAVATGIVAAGTAAISAVATLFLLGVAVGVVVKVHVMQTVPNTSSRAA